MSSISDMMKADGVEINYKNLLKAYEVRHYPRQPIPALRGITAEDQVVNSAITENARQVLKLVKNIPYAYADTDSVMVDIEVNPKTDKIMTIAKATPNGIEVSYATNRCKCGCYLHQHEYNTQTDKVPCKRRHKVKCEDYGH